MPINFNEVQEQKQLIDDGRYEVEISRSFKHEKNGYKYLSLQYTVRSTVDQNCKGCVVYDTFWLDKNEANAKEGWYDLLKTRKILLTQPNGKMLFDTPDELLVYLTGLHMTVDIVKTFNDKTGKEDNEIKDGSYGPSEWDKTHPAEEQTAVENNTAELDVPDSEVPF